MPWAVAAAGIGLVGSVYSANKQSGAVKDATSSANAIADQTKAEAKPLYQPYIDNGTNALSQYADINGLNGADAASTAMGKFTASPGYQYQVDQGLRAIDHGAAARGSLNSGATLKAEETLGSNLANQDFGKYLERLNGLATVGMNGVNGYTNVVAGQGNQQQSSLMSQGGALSSIYGNEAKGISGSLSGLANNTDVQNSLSGLGGYPSGDFGSGAGYTAPAGSVGSSGYHVGGT